MIVFEDVSIVRGGRTVWSDGTFTIEPGSVVGVIGPNGSGKTTMLELILGLLAPTTGHVEVFGDDPRRGRHRIGYVPQNYTAAVGDVVRCRDLVALGANGTTWGPGRSRVTAAVDEALDAVGALDFANQRLSAVSGGQQQRVAIAQGIVTKPELLLLDEPLANLDLRTQYEIVELLSSLSAERAMTIVIVAHDLNPLLHILTGAVYLLDGHAHYDEIGNVVDSDLLSHLYGTAISVVHTPQGDLFTRSVGE